MNEDLEAWAQIVIERWQKRMKQLRIGEVGTTKELLKSFQASVHRDAGGDAQKIVFTYLYYGKFPDMGVGKGVPYNLVGKKGTRVAKPWMGKIFFSELQKLGRIMAEKLGEQAVINIIEGMENV